MLKPPISQPKSKEHINIRIIAPSGALSPKDIADSIEKIEQFGYQMSLGPNLFKKEGTGYNYAGSKNQRLTDLQEALNSSDLIWCARGGYGAIHLLDELDYTQFKEKPKWLIGYSDITALHNQINNLGFPSIHGVTFKPLSLGNSNESYQEVLNIIEGRLPSYEFSHSLNSSFTDFSAPIVGGNLSIIYSQLGSSTQVDCKGKVLFLEDWYENFYHLDRMLMNLDRNGLLTEAKAILLGGFTKMDTQEENPNYDKDFDPLAYQVIQERLAHLDKPIMYGFPAGHLAHNLPLIFGQTTQFKNRDGSVKITF